jgi:hypothetical protein
MGVIWCDSKLFQKPILCAVACTKLVAESVTTLYNANTFLAEDFVMNTNGL